MENHTLLCWEEELMWPLLQYVEIRRSCVVGGDTTPTRSVVELSAPRIPPFRYTYRYGEPIPVEQLIVQLCDLKQGYTQVGGLRPFGVSFLMAG